MKIRIIGSNPKNADEKDITRLIGQEFEVKEIDADGHYIPYGPTGLYLVHPEEFEVIKEAEA